MFGCILWAGMLLSGGAVVCTDGPVRADAVSETVPTVVAGSQRSALPDVGETFYVYCRLGTKWKMGGVYVYLDFGIDKLRPYLTDEAGERLVFDSRLEALNYLSARGWELAHVYPKVDDGDSSERYLIRKRLCDFTPEERAVYEECVRR